MSNNEENNTALAAPANGSAAGREPKKGNSGYPVYSRYPAIQVEKNSVREYWRIIRKHKWMVIATLVVLVTIVTIGTLMSRPVYRAEAKIEIGKDMTVKVGGAGKLEVTKALEISAQEITIKAMKKIEIAVGTSKITLEPAQLTIEGTMIATKASAINEIKGALVKIN